MSILTAVPSSNPATSGYDDWVANTGTKVTATATNDGDTSYISVSSPLDQALLVTLPTTILTINSIRIGVVVRYVLSSSSNQMVAGIKRGSTPYYDLLNITGSYGIYYGTTYTTDPNTGLPWVNADIATTGLVIGNRGAEAQEQRCTMMFMEFDAQVAPNSSSTFLIG